MDLKVKHGNMGLLQLIRNLRKELSIIIQKVWISWFAWFSENDLERAGSLLLENLSEFSDGEMRKNKPIVPEKQPAFFSRRINRLGNSATSFIIDETLKLMTKRDKSYQPSTIYRGTSYNNRNDQLTIQRWSYHTSGSDAQTATAIN